jgi:hypothetical protein
VGSVIRSAEIQELVPALLAALADPNTKSKVALDTLLGTTFVNAVDAASLALIVPVVHRGLRDRSGDTKKKAARTVGNMCGLINDPKVGICCLCIPGQHCRLSCHESECPLTVLRMCMSMRVSA